PHHLVCRAGGEEPPVRAPPHPPRHRARRAPKTHATCSAEVFLHDLPFFKGGAEYAAFSAEHGLTNRYDAQNLCAATSTPGWHRRLKDMLEAGNIPLPGLVIAPAAAGAAYGALSDNR